MSSEPSEASRPALRRDVTVWGSYMWGFADVGADVFAALGLVVVSAQGGANVAFALGGLVYIMIGLAYAELASAYPVAGGGQYFTLRGLGDIWGFIAGSALLLSYTIDIALFSAASTGYLNGLIGFIFAADITSVVVHIGPVHMKVVWLVETLLLIVFLIWLNIRGVRESSLFNQWVGIVGIIAEVAIVVVGFFFAWRQPLMVEQWSRSFPKANEFMYATSLAIISFVGLESIAQAAQETRRPATIVPRTSITLVFTVFIFAVGFSTLALGIMPWSDFIGHEQEAVALLASRLPLVGAFAGPFAALVGALVLAISANSGVMGVSRVTYSMSRYYLLPVWFDHIHERFRTPVRTIVVFSLFGVVATVLSFLTEEVMYTLGSMYAFGAALGYTLMFISLIKLRFSDPYSPRPYMIPLNVSLRRGDHTVAVPILGLVGALGVATILCFVLLTHEVGRVAGAAWVLGCLAFYVWYRKRMGLPLGTLKRHWEQEQVAILTEAEEYEMLEAYRDALHQRDRRRPPAS